MHMLKLMAYALQYRDFVFRKMFEKPVVISEGRCHEIASNVRELTRLDRQ